MSYGYPPPNPQHQQWYGAQAVPPVDPYRAWYAEQLATLTFNSRYIIQNLSIEAKRQRDEGNMTAMQAIAEEIEHAVLRAPPTGKLPLLYLIDSISKNAGPPYTDHLFPAYLPRLYPKTYREVDGETKNKMIELLKLWRTGGPQGSELYPPAVRDRVEREIFGSLGAPLTQPEVQATLREYLKAKENEMALEFSPKLAKTVNVLVKIDQVLSSSQVAPQELANIMDKISGMKAGLDPSSINQRQQPPAVPPQPFYAGRDPRQQQQQQQPPYPAPPSAGYHGAPGFPPPAPSFPPPNSYAPRIPSAVPTPPPAAPLAIPAIPLNVADILRNLNNSGVLSQPRTPEPTGNKSNLESYEDMILAFNIHIDHFDLSKLSLQVSHLPERCQQCGMRFPDREGDKFKAHMDWHFRRNRKERELEGRGAHRRWLPRLTEWVNENAEAGPSSPKPEVHDPRLTAERLAALKRQWVRTPSDSVKAARPCPICKEQFKSVWSEDEEEWAFMNAVEVNGVIYHATCRAEKISAATAARLLKGEKRASPSPAPEENKRKAVDEGESDVKRVKVEVGVENGDSAEGVKGVDETKETEVQVKIEPGSIEAEAEAEEEAEAEKTKEGEGGAMETADPAQAEAEVPAGSEDQDPAASQTAN